MWCVLCMFALRYIPAERSSNASQDWTTCSTDRCTRKEKQLQRHPGSSDQKINKKRRGRETDLISFQYRLSSRLLSLLKITRLWVLVSSRVVRRRWCRRRAAECVPPPSLSAGCAPPPQTLSASHSAQHRVLIGCSASACHASHNNEDQRERWTSLLSVFSGLQGRQFVSPN